MPLISAYICYSSHQEGESISPPLESGLSLQLSPTERLLQEAGCASFRPRLKRSSRIHFWLLGTWSWHVRKSRLSCWKEAIQRKKPSRRQLHERSCGEEHLDTLTKSQYQGSKNVNETILNPSVLVESGRHHTGQRQIIPTEPCPNADPKNHEQI